MWSTTAGKGITFIQSVGLYLIIRSTMLTIVRGNDVSLSVMSATIFIYAITHNNLPFPMYLPINVTDSGNVTGTPYPV